MPFSFDGQRCSRCGVYAHAECLLRACGNIYAEEPDAASSSTALVRDSPAKPKAKTSLRPCRPPFLPLLYDARAQKPADNNPLLVFVNGRSGGQQGPTLLRKFRRMLGKNQVGALVFVPLFRAVFVLFCFVLFCFVLFRFVLFCFVCLFV